MVYFPLPFKRKIVKVKKLANIYAKGKNLADIWTYLHDLLIENTSIYC